MQTRKKAHHPHAQAHNVSAASGLIKLGLFAVTVCQGTSQMSSVYTEVKKKNPTKKRRLSSLSPSRKSEARDQGKQKNEKKISHSPPPSLRKPGTRHSKKKELEGDEEKIEHPPPSRRRKSGAQGSRKKADEKEIRRRSQLPPLRSEAQESEKKEGEDKIRINRAPVLTMWVAVVVEREGFKFEEGLSFGKAIAGLMARSKGRSLGIYEEPTDEKKAERKRKRKDLDRFRVFGMNVPGKIMQDGLHLALQGGKPISPSLVENYLHKSFGPNYDRAKVAMEDLAKSYRPQEVGEAAYSLYEKFRPTVAHGIKGWGAKGVLDVEFMQALSKQAIHV